MSFSYLGCDWIAFSQDVVAWVAHGGGMHCSVWPVAHARLRQNVGMACTTISLRSALFCSLAYMFYLCWLPAVMEKGEKGLRLLAAMSP